MKKVIILIVILLLPLYSFAQYQNPGKEEKSPAKESTSYPVYLGFGSGFNHYTGLIGLSAEGKIFGNFTLLGDLGIGSFFKASAGIRYYQHYSKGLFYGLGVSYSPGADSVNIKLETTTSGNTTEKVALKLNNIETLNLSIGYAWKLGKRARFNLETGYALLLNSKPYEVLTPGVVLTSTSKAIMNLTIPGGFLFGLGFSFGLK